MADYNEAKMDNRELKRIQFYAQLEDGLMYECSWDCKQLIYDAYLDNDITAREYIQLMSLVSEIKS